jgi:hypothetical protein
LKPTPFEYHAPSKLSEALDILASAENARPLAGGQSLVPMLKKGPDCEGAYRGRSQAEGYVPNLEFQLRPSTHLFLTKLKFYLA